MDKTTKILVAGAVFIILAAVLGGWFKTADTKLEKVPKASTVAETTTTQPPRQPTTTAPKETTTQHRETTTTMPEKPGEQEPVNGILKLETQGYTEYKGYKFQLDHAILAVGYKVAGLRIDVVKPDGTNVKVQADNRVDGLVDLLKIHFDGKYQQDADGKYIEEGWVRVKVWELEPVNGILKLETQKYAEYKGYKLRLNQLMYKDEKVFAIFMDVVKPDGIEIKLQTNNLAAESENWAIGVVDSLEIEFHGEYSENPDWAIVKIRESMEQEPLNDILKLESLKYTEYNGYKFKLNHSV